MWGTLSIIDSEPSCKCYSWESDFFIFLDAFYSRSRETIIELMITSTILQLSYNSDLDNSREINRKGLFLQLSQAQYTFHRSKFAVFFSIGWKFQVGTMTFIKVSKKSIITWQARRQVVRASGTLKNYTWEHANST